MNLSNLNDLENLIANGYISKRKHPKANLFILNYTAKTQYENIWNEHTIKCRGLIVDENYQIQARCFDKFFNYEQVTDKVSDLASQNKKFEIYEKVDGSLGIGYWLDDEFKIATRGSFDSEQAQKANEIFANKYKNVVSLLNKNHTYLFEIIYKENKICVDYGDKEDLVLLAIFDTKTGVEQTLNCEYFEIAKKYDYSQDFDYLKNLNIKNKEGFVVRSDCGFRFKIKFEDYVLLHKFVFSLSNKVIWQSLRENKKIDIDQLPDEMYDWLKITTKQINEEYDCLHKKCLDIFNLIKTDDRKEFASKALKYAESSVLFKMLDNKPYKDVIWKLIEPKSIKYAKNNNFIDS